MEIENCYKYSPDPGFWFGEILTLFTAGMSVLFWKWKKPWAFFIFKKDIKRLVIDE